jgi:hypothetical protein
MQGWLRRHFYTGSEDSFAAEAVLIGVVGARLADHMISDPVEVAEDIVGLMIYQHPDLVQRVAYPPGIRWWLHPRSHVLSGSPRVFLGGDEYGNRTVAVDIPFIGLLVVALNIPLRRAVESPSVCSCEDSNTGA